MVVIGDAVVVIVMVVAVVKVVVLDVVVVVEVVVVDIVVVVVVVGSVSCRKLVPMFDMAHLPPPSWSLTLQYSCLSLGKAAMSSSSPSISPASRGEGREQLEVGEQPASCSGFSWSTWSIQNQITLFLYLKEN